MTEIRCFTAAILLCFSFPKIAGFFMVVIVTKLCSCSIGAGDGARTRDHVIEGQSSTLVSRWHGKQNESQRYRAENGPSTWDHAKMYHENFRTFGYTKNFVKVVLFDDHSQEPVMGSCHSTEQRSNPGVLEIVSPKKRTVP